MRRNCKKPERRSRCTTEKRRSLVDSKAWVRQIKIELHVLATCKCLSFEFPCDVPVRVCRSQSGRAERSFEEGLQSSHSNPAQGTVLTLWHRCMTSPMRAPAEYD